MPSTIAASINLDRLEKQPRESRVYGMSFKDYKEIKNGQSIIDIDAIDKTPEGTIEITPVGPADDDLDGIDEVAAFRIEGGTAGEVYKISVVVTTTEGDILEGDGILEIID